MVSKNSFERQIGRDTSPSAVMLAATKEPERRRGSWSFLTWAFVLGDLLAAELFVGRSAQADPQATDQGDDTASRGGGGHSNSPSDDISSSASGIVTTADEPSGEEGTPQHNSHSPLAAFHLDPLLQGAAKPMEIRLKSDDVGTATSDSGGGDGGGGGGGVDGGDEDGWVLRHHRHCCHDVGTTGSPDSDGTAVDVGADDTNIGSDATGVHAVADGSIQAGVDVNQLLGFDIQVSEDGAFVSANSDLWSELNSDHLVSQLTQDLGLANLDLRPLLGFDVQVSSGGVLLLSDLVPGTLSAGVDLNNLLNGLVPQSPAAGSLIEDLGKPAGLPGLIGDLTDNLAHAGDVIGLPGPDNAFLDQANTTSSLTDTAFSLFSLAARIPTTVPSEVVGGTPSADVPATPSAPLTNASLLTTPLDTLTAQSSDGASESQTPVGSAILTVTSLSDQLGVNGDLSPGNTITLIGSPAPSTNELFTGTSYTDYNMALQSPLSNSSTIAVPPAIEPTDTSTTTPTIDLQPSGTDPSPTALKPVQDASSALVPIQTATGDLVGHTHL
ncbi:MAG TPA: hypothetical protein VH684_20385 [Xanthobacteraceae bacterium]